MPKLGRKLCFAGVSLLLQTSFDQLLGSSRDSLEEACRTLCFKADDATEILLSTTSSGLAHHQGLDAAESLGSWTPSRSGLK